MAAHVLHRVETQKTGAAHAAKCRTDDCNPQWTECSELMIGHSAIDRRVASIVNCSHLSWTNHNKCHRTR
jgi:hypothetical protein